MIGSTRRRATNCGKYLLACPCVVHSLVVIFGISAWIGINGIYVQLPLLVITAPEGWNLAAYIVVTIQAANAGPLIYALARKFRSPLDEAACILALLATGSLAMGFLAFYYQETLYVGGERRSVPMFVCVFLTALVGCTSSVLFMPYLRDSDGDYLVSYFVGEGLSGVVPSVVAFVQGVGGNAGCKDYRNGTVVEIVAEPRFPPRDYFIFLFVVLLSSLGTFALLRYLPSLEREASGRTVAQETDEKQRRELEPKDLRADSDVRNYAACCNREISPSVDNSDGEEMSAQRTIYMHVLLSIICFLGNGFLPGIQTFSCLPYGNVAFHLTVTLANIANPIACLFSFWFNSVKSTFLDALTVLGMSTSAYVIFLAAVSPVPPMRDSNVGVATVVAAWILLTSVISYLKLSITSKIRTKLGPKALIDVGIYMQFGSACGAVLSFVLINYTDTFQQHKPCTPL